MNRRVLVPLIFLAACHVLALFAGFFSPEDPAYQHRSLPFAPPSRIHFVDGQGRLHLRPFVYPLVPLAATGEYREDRRNPCSVRFFAGGPAYSVFGIGELRLHLFRVDPPAMLALLGTDQYGRDQFSRFLFGAQISLIAGALAAALAISAGLVLGIIAGYYGSWIDQALMHLAELFMSLPWLYLLVGARALLPLHLPPRTAFLCIVGLLGVIGWARPARLVRGVALTAREREYVRAAVGFGASDLYLMRRHVLPQLRGLLLTHASLLVPRYVMAEVNMSFLGLGVNEPSASWGSLLAAVFHHYPLTSYWWMWLPVLLIVPVFAAYSALANAVRRHKQLTVAQAFGE